MRLFSLSTPYQTKLDILFVMKMKLLLVLVKDMSNATEIKFIFRLYQNKEIFRCFIFDM